MDALSRIPGVSQLRQQLSGARYTTLPRDGDAVDSEVLFQSEEDALEAAGSGSGEQHPLSERIPRIGVEPPDPELDDPESEEHAQFVHDHAYRSRRRRRGGRIVAGSQGFNVKVSTLWKALAALVTLWALWFGMKYVWPWFIGAHPGMPAFGERLGCSNAIYYYTNDAFFTSPDNYTSFTLPLATREGADAFLLRTEGRTTSLTLTLERQPDPYISDLILVAAFHSPASFFDFSVAGVGPTFEDAPHFFFEALPDVDYCILVDIILYLPANLESLTLDLQTLSQVKFGDSLGSFANGTTDAQPRLKSLDISLHSSDEANLISPTLDLVAEVYKISVGGGYLVGSIPLASSLDIAAGDAATVDVTTVVFPSLPPVDVGEDGGNVYDEDERARAEPEDEPPAMLETHSGTTPFQLTFQNPSHTRCVNALHQSTGDLTLSYGGFFHGRASWEGGGGGGGKGRVSGVGAGGRVTGVGDGGFVGGGGCDVLRANCGGRLKLDMLS